MAALSPKYRQIADELRARIRSGEYAPGDRLPSMADLMAAHRVALGTVKDAIGVLTDEGLAYKEQGRGTFVSNPLPEEARSEFEQMSAAIEELSEQVRLLDARMTAHEERGRL